ncbi:uncharacterized, partial [Tachysurus ichikawai]
LMKEKMIVETQIAFIRTSSAGSSHLSPILGLGSVTLKQTVSSDLNVTLHHSHPVRDMDGCHGGASAVGSWARLQQCDVSPLTRCEN